MEVKIEYKEDKSLVLLEGSSYIVFIEVIIGDELASYILHCEGNARVILRLWLKNKHKVHKTVYYQMKDMKVLGSHSEQVVGELYKYIGEQ